jgi:hypothetical protein
VRFRAVGRDEFEALERDLDAGRIGRESWIAP